MNLRDLDLNLLLVFDAIYSERSITKAADKLTLSQPAVSNALGRLRSQLDDQLFERDGKGMMPTPEADRLAPSVHAALKSIEMTLDSKTDFDPKTSDMVFKIIAADGVTFQIMHPLINKAATTAPGITFELLELSLDTWRDELVAKDAHVALFVTPINDDQIRSSHLISTPTCVVLREGHPMIEGKTSLSENDFFALDWIKISSRMRRHSNFHKEAKATGRSRRAVCTVPRIIAVPYMVSETDLAGILPRPLAASLADKLRLRLFDVPIKVPEETWYMVWNADYTDDPAHLWLRNAMRAAVT